MNKMYPLILKAPLKDYIWGGTKLKDEYGFKSELERVAEAWVVSCHEDGKCEVINGEMAGKTLNEVLDIWGKDALGDICEGFDSFPILVKLIDAKDRLSVQVHPSDEYARKNEGDNGKTEMWYVVDCDEGAKLVYGFNRSITKDEFSRKISDNTLDEVLNYVNVHKGDIFFIKSGTVHAIGKGILIAEIQENSNVTYRVSDYGRLGADGKPRALHIDKAVEVASLEPSSVPYGNVGSTEVIDGGKATVRELASCEYFTAKAIKLDGAEISIPSGKGFASLVVLEGEVTLVCCGESYNLKKGGSVFIPAGIDFKVSGCCEVLYAGA